MKVFKMICAMLFAGIVGVIATCLTVPDYYYLDGLGDLIMAAFCVWGVGKGVYGLFYNPVKAIAKESPYSALESVVYIQPIFCFVGIAISCFSFWLYITEGFIVSGIVCLVLYFISCFLLKMWRNSLAASINKEEEIIKDEKFPEAGFFDESIYVLESAEDDGKSFNAFFDSGTYYSAFDKDNERPSLTLNAYTDNEERLIFKQAIRKKGSAFEAIQTLYLYFDRECGSEVCLTFTAGTIKALIDGRFIDLKVS